MGFMTQINYVGTPFTWGWENMKYYCPELKRRWTVDDDLLSHGPGLEEIGKIIEPILVTLTSKTYLSVAVALDHSIYTLGGTDPYIFLYILEPYIQCLDTTHVDNGWKHYNMNMARIGPQVG